MPNVLKFGHSVIGIYLEIICLSVDLPQGEKLE